MHFSKACGSDYNPNWYKMAIVFVAGSFTNRACHYRSLWAIQFHKLSQWLCIPFAYVVILIVKSILSICPKIPDIRLNITKYLLDNEACRFFIWNYRLVSQRNEIIFEKIVKMAMRKTMCLSNTSCAYAPHIVIEHWLHLVLGISIPIPITLSSFIIFIIFSITV